MKCFIEPGEKRGKTCEITHRKIQTVASLVASSYLDRWTIIKDRQRTSASFHYLLIFHLCLLGEDGGYINAVEATSQNGDDKKVEDEADEINPTLLFAGAIRYFLFDPLLLQIRLGV